MCSAASRQSKNSTTKDFGSQQDDSIVDIPEGQVKTIKDESVVSDGSW
jgi:hypothetical protein